jgi:cation transport ATPase
LLLQSLQQDANKISMSRSTKYSFSSSSHLNNLDHNGLADVAGNIAMVTTATTTTTQIPDQQYDAEEKETEEDANNAKLQQQHEQQQHEEQQQEKQRNILASKQRRALKHWKALSFRVKVIYYHIILIILVIIVLYIYSLFYCICLHYRCVYLTVGDSSLQLVLFYV